MKSEGEKKERFSIYKYTHIHNKQMENMQKYYNFDYTYHREL